MSSLWTFIKLNDQCPQNDQTHVKNLAVLGAG